jgi:tetratricopeptide (TPR) repeat protein
MSEAKRAARPAPGEIPRDGSPGAVTRLAGREAEAVLLHAELAARDAALAEMARHNRELEAALDAMREERDLAVQTAGELEEIADAAQSAIEVLRGKLAAAETKRDVLSDKADGLAAERDRLAAERTAWFEAAITTEMQRLERSRRRRGWRIGRFILHLMPARGRGTPMYRADRARAAGEWHRAARFYLDALAQLPGPQPTVWIQLGHALNETGRIAEAELAYRRAVDLDSSHGDALVALGQILRRQGQDAEAASTYRRALEAALAAEQRGFVARELAALGDPTEA